MKKSINILVTESGNKYFYIYEVKAQKLNGEIIVCERELSEKSASETAELLRNLSEIYTSAWVRKQMVWC